MREGSAIKWGYSYSNTLLIFQIELKSNNIYFFLSLNQVTLNKRRLDSLDFLPTGPRADMEFVTDARTMSV